MEIRYYADFAEVPAQAETRRMEREGSSYAGNRIRELIEKVTLTMDGKPLDIDVKSSQAVKLPGQGGLETVTVIALLSAAWPSTWSAPRRLSFRDDNFRGLQGWHEIRVQVAELELVSPVRSQLMLMPGEIFKPLSYDGKPRSDRRLEIVLGPGAAQKAGGAEQLADLLPLSRPGSQDPLVDLIGADALTPPMLLFALAVSAALGASHALSPGHGKTVVAAYLVGSRGTVIHAVVLGLVVTITHISSVLVLGVITLYLSEFVMPERLYPWLGVFSGVAVAVIGGSLLVRRITSSSTQTMHSHHHAQPEAGSRAAENRQHHGHGPDTSGGDDKPVSLWQLLVLGITGGIVPCPSALVVLLAAVALHRIALGLALILAFSVGLAVVLVAIGVLAVKAYSLFARFEYFGSVSRGLGLASAAAVTVLGVLIAVKTGAALL